MVNICAEYGASWNIKFNSAKMSVSVLMVVSHLLILLCCMIILFNGFIS